MTMFIHELAQASGVSAKTIRYYESIGLMPEPPRAENNYRQYPPDALERLRFIVSARSLDFSLTDIAEFLSARDEGTLPCKRVLDSIDGRIADLDRRIAASPACWLCATTSAVSALTEKAFPRIKNVMKIVFAMSSPPIRNLDWSQANVRRKPNVRSLWHDHQGRKRCLHSRHMRLFFRDSK
jgi:DNA-binding transcriptional MerR regulator